MFESFSKFGYLDPYNRMPNTKEVLFFTRPDLHIVNTDTNKLVSNLSGVPFFVDLKLKYPEVLHDLQVSWKRKNNNNPFIVSLHNRVKDTMELPDINSTDIDIPSNTFGNDYEYRGSSEASDDKHSFSLEFEDTKHLDIYMFFRAYEEYERLKRLGRVYPTEDYIFRKELHDQIAIYKFVLLDDFSTICHYSKAVGCFPTGVPRSVFNSNDFQSTGLSLSINWKCAFIEDMNPLILSDFNVNMKQYKKGTAMPLTGSDGRINRNWAHGARVVEMENQSGDNIYKLVWYT
jgi:hypothetical protein